jgi:rhodanese-related sulfurtransferase
MIRQILDKFFWVILIFLGFYVLYQKAIILANFESISPKVAYEMLQNDENVTLVDVRTPQEFKQDGRIDGAKLVPLSYLEANLKMIDKSKKVLVYCHSGSRSVSAARILSDHGYTVLNMRGGISSWQSEKLPVK